jgi:hypothetical protein
MKLLTHERRTDDGKDREIMGKADRLLDVGKDGYVITDM